MKPKLLVFASGSETGGGSGFENLVTNSRGKGLRADIVGVVSNYDSGGVRMRAAKLGIPFIHFPKPYTAEMYQKIACESHAQYFALSGWVKLVCGLDLNTVFNPKTVFNIHPGPLPNFGGFKMYGENVHKAVLEAYKRGEIVNTTVTMHYVTEPQSKDDYDRGPVFFTGKVQVRDDDTVQTLQKRVNTFEHFWQPAITDLVVTGCFKWDGVDRSTLKEYLSFA